ncbi:MAG: sel1 repeat family protein [Thiomargarita sp.]|nr:sel1 repeat family protein [Thiomargarita sp.]
MKTGELSDDDLMTLRSGIAAFETKQFVRAYNLLTPIAELGNPEAKYRLAVMAQNGLGQVASPEKALNWMTSAATEQKFDLAQHGLGFMYMEGECVEQDDEKAAYWFRQAAEQGLIGAQTTLASLYEQGRGVEKDMAEAKRWYALAGFDMESKS